MPKKTDSAITHKPAERKTILPHRQPNRGHIAHVARYPEIDPHKHFAESLNLREVIPVELLRASTRVTPVRRAIDRIVDGILSMGFSVQPAKDKLDNTAAIEQARNLEACLLMPNQEEHVVFLTFLYALVEEMMVMGFAAIERQPGYESDRPFWLFVANGANITYNPYWKPGMNTPRYFDRGDAFDEHGRPLMDEDLFVIQKRASAHTTIPASPVETVFPHVCAWLALHNFQRRTTGKASSEYLLDIGDVSLAELEAFRSYYRDKVQGSGEIPVLGGKGKINVVKLGAASDAGLYLQYNDVLLKTIAMGFNLTPRDYLITEHDNRATSGAAADASFQEAILPYAICIFRFIEVCVIQYYAPGFRLILADTEPRTEEQEGNLAATLYEKGLITLNEARIRAKQDPIGPAGDRFADGTQLLPEEEQKKQIEEQKKLEEEQRKQAAIAPAQQEEQPPPEQKEETPPQKQAQPQKPPPKPQDSKKPDKSQPIAASAHA